jgi:dehydrogenase
VSKAGTSKVLEYKEVDIPKLKEGWSLVKVKGFGINRSEIFTRKGFSPSVKFPRILGIECVGEIAESKVFKKGEKVISIMGEMGRDFDGSYAEYVLLPNKQIYKVDTKLSWSDLAAVPETFYTAFGSMKNLQIDENDKVFIRAASSATGIAFLKLLKAKYTDMKIYGSTGKKEKIQILKSQGFTDIILDIGNELQTDLQFDKILELIGPKTIKNSIKHLKEGGIICSTGQLGEEWYLREFDPIMELKNNVYLTSFYSGNVSAEKINEMLAYIEKYRVNISPEKVFCLEDTDKAHDYVESGNNFGKVVVEVL